MFFSGENVQDDWSVPAGRYQVRIAECGKEAKKNDPSTQFFKLTFEILNGEYAGQSIYISLIADHANAKARNIGHRKMKQVAIAATGTHVIASSQVLINKRLVIDLGKREYQGKKYDELMGASPISGLAKTPENKPDFNEMEDIPF